MDTLSRMTSSRAREHRLPLAPPGGRPAWTKDGKVILLPTVADVSRIDPRTGRIEGRVDLQAELVSSTVEAVSPNGSRSRCQNKPCRRNVDHGLPVGEPSSSLG